MTPRSAAGGAASDRMRVTLRNDGVRAYLVVRGVRPSDAARLYRGYLRSYFRKLLRPDRFSCVGESLPGSIPVLVRFQGVQAWVRPGTNDLDLLVHHEPRSRAWFAPRPGDTVVDVGAHVGLYTLLGAKAGAQVVAIEPDQENRAILEANVRQNTFPNVRVLPSAVSDRRGEVLLRRPNGPNRGTVSIVGPPAESGARPGDTVVACDTLDSLLRPFAFSQIDWLKVDVEGHELSVLRGGGDTLRSTRHLILEVTDASSETCRSTVAAAGFRLAGEEQGHPASNWFLERVER